MKLKKNKKKNSGVVLVLAITMVIILSLIGVGLLRLGLNARMQAVKDVLQISARSAADAGIEHAVWYMINGWNGAANKPAWLASWNDATVWTDPAVPATAIGYSFGPIDLDGTYGDASFTYNIYKGTKPTGYQIISTGMAGGKTSIVHAAVTLRSMFFGVGVKESVELKNSSIVRVIPADEDLLIQTNNIEAGKLDFKNGVYVPGDVFCGPGGDIYIVLITKQDVEITGETGAAEDYIDFSSVPLPSLPAGSSIPDPDYAKGIIITPATAGQYSSLILKNNPKKLTITGGDVVMYVTGAVELGNGNEINVAEGSSLTLYLGDSLIAKNGSIITYSNLDEVANPTDAQIEEAAHAITLKGTDTCDVIDIRNSGDFYGSIYAPDTSLIIHNSGDLYGGFVGLDMEIKNSGEFVFVRSLYNLDDVEVLYMGIKHGSWWEE